MAPVKGSEESLAYARLLLQMDELKSQSQVGPQIEQVSLGRIGPLKAIISILGLPVEEKEDYFERTPWVTWSLIVLCTLVSLWGFQQYGFRPSEFQLQYRSFSTDQTLRHDHFVFLSRGMASLGQQYVFPVGLR